MRTKKIKKSGPALVNFKILPSERRQLLRNAERFAGGNVSEWIRRAACRAIKTRVS